MSFLTNSRIPKKPLNKISLVEWVKVEDTLILSGKAKNKKVKESHVGYSQILPAIKDIKYVKLNIDDNTFAYFSYSQLCKKLEVFSFVERIYFTKLNSVLEILDIVKYFIKKNGNFVELNISYMNCNSFISLMSLLETHYEADDIILDEVVVEKTKKIYSSKFLVTFMKSLTYSRTHEVQSFLFPYINLCGIFNYNSAYANLTTITIPVYKDEDEFTKHLLLLRKSSLLKQIQTFNTENLIITKSYSRVCTYLFFTMIEKLHIVDSVKVETSFKPFLSPSLYSFSFLSLLYLTRRKVNFVVRMRMFWPRVIRNVNRKLHDNAKTRLFYYIKREAKNKKLHCSSTSDTFSPCMAMSFRRWM
eukprot:snap_masked-scaffold_1-processed-gene-6.9-mRNA-1 protein AED:1.00 eAED:1.00 QI:0/0/0/0/1/1/2/0/359